MHTHTHTLPTAAAANTLTMCMCVCLYRDCCAQNVKRRNAGAVFTIGVVGRCLSKALVQAKSLTPKCRELVLIAAPKDSRVYLQYPESASALVQKIAELQRAAGGCGDGGSAVYVSTVALDVMTCIT